MIRVTIDRIVVEGLALSEREVRERLEKAALRLAGREADGLSEREISMVIREAFDV